MQQATAQEAFVTNGGDGSGSGGSLSYSVGIVNYTSIAGSDASVSQGVQHAYEVSQVTGIEETIIDLSINAYPNPTSDYLTLSFEKLPEGEVTYELIDAGGKLIDFHPVQSEVSTIDMKDQPAGNYLLKININNQERSSYKIIKY